ncbi:MAG: NADPH-dependent F420 reductase [Nitrosopumilus sp. H8]|nr:MAG: NADPH-dependent F420 reductase [Nitrosopumilus sp. H8]
MKIGIIGGTGGMGKGFALRWCQNHDVVIGSRDSARAAEAAGAYEALAKEAFGGVRGIAGADNIAVAESSDVLVLSIPYGNIDAVCSEILPKIRDECTVVSPIVPMEKTDVGFEFLPVRDGKPSSYEAVARHMGNPSRLVSAFHVISEKKLANPKLELDYDIFVCGDDDGAVGAVTGLINEIAGLRPVYLGPGRLSYMAEIATPLLLNAMIRNKMKNPGIKIV